MKHILGPTGRRVVTEFARASTLVALDFDGTLAPIVADRDVATMTASTRTRLAALCDRYPTAVISGRARRDVEARLEGASIGQVIGNHGIEPTEGMDIYEPAIRALGDHLATTLDLPGVEVEDKRYSLAIHYQRAPSQSVARGAVLRALSGWPGATRVTHGKALINVLPAGAPHKGDALVACLARVGADRAVYIGDDLTDEDVFELGRPDWLLAIRVGRSATSAAPWFLRSQADIDALLAGLVTLRAQAP